MKGLVAAVGAERLAAVDIAAVDIAAVAVDETDPGLRVIEQEILAEHAGEDPRIDDALALLQADRESERPYVSSP